MKADLLVVDLASADVGSMWQEIGAVGDTKTVVTPFLDHFCASRLGLAGKNQSILLAQPEKAEGVWPSLGWLTGLVGAKTVIVLERVLSVTRVLSPGDVVIPSRALVLAGEGISRIDSLISRGLYLRLVKATPESASSRIFHRGSYCLISGLSGLETYVLEQGYNHGFEIAGLGLSCARENLPAGVDLASICVVEQPVAVESAARDIGLFAETVCSLLKNLG